MILPLWSRDESRLKNIFSRQGYEELQRAFFLRELPALES